jgi:hypothetical protein
MKQLTHEQIKQVSAAGIILTAVTIFSIEVLRKATAHCYDSYKEDIGELACYLRERTKEKFFSLKSWMNSSYSRLTAAKA